MSAVTIEEIADSVDYGVTASATNVAGGPKFLRITDIQDDFVNWDRVPYCEPDAKGIEKSRLKPGDIVFARTGATTGKSYLLQECPPGSVFASYLIRLRLQDGADPAYVAQYFKSTRYWNQITSFSEGVAQPGVNATKLKNIVIPLPPLEEQRRIAAILDAADQLRTKRRQALAKLDTLTQAIFIDMFGDSELPQVRIDKLGSVGSGATPKKGNPRFYEEGTIPWVTSGQLGGPFVTDYADLITETALRETSVKIWPRGALLIAMYGEGKTRGHCSELTFEATSNQACAAVVLSDDAPVSSTYLKTYLMSRYEENRRLAAGGVQPNLNLGLIKAMTVPLPDQEQLEVFDRACADAANMGEAVTLSLGQLDTLFGSLQQRAFRGEL